MKQKTPYILLVIATLFWGGNFVIGKGLSTSIPPFTLALMRWVIAFIILLPFAWKECVTHIPLWKKHWKLIILMGVTGIAGFNSLVYIALHYTTSINATLVNSTAPAIITLFSFIFLREHLTKRHYAGILLSIIGVGWIISRGSFQTFQNFSFNLGELIIIAAVITWSVYSILVKKYNTLFPTYGLLLITIFVGNITLLPLSLFEIYNNIPMEFSFISILGLFYLGICASLISFLSWNKAVEIIGPAKASPFLNLIPVFASFFAISFLGEQFQLFQLIGGCIVISGVLLTTNIPWASKQHKNTATEKM